MCQRAQFIPLAADLLALCVDIFVVIVVQFVELLGNCSNLYHWVLICSKKEKVGKNLEHNQT